MTEQTTKGEALAAIERERADWETLLGEIGEDRMLEPGPMGEWTFKDLVAHLNGWRTHSLAKIEAVTHGQAAPEPAWPAELGPGDDDDERIERINDWMHEQNADRLLTEVLQESREGYARIAAVVEMLPEGDLDDPARFPALDGAALGPALVSGAFFSHLHEEHEPAIRAWLAKPPPARPDPGVEL